MLGSIIKYLRALGAQNLKSASANNASKVDVRSQAIYRKDGEDSGTFWHAQLT